MNIYKSINEGFKNKYCSKIEEEQEVSNDEEQEMFHNAKGYDFIVIKRNDSGKNALLRDLEGTMYIAAQDCPQGNGSWGKAHFFNDISTAEDYFDKHLT